LAVPPSERQRARARALQGLTINLSSIA
jgi:hypothetical protein